MENPFPTSRRPLSFRCSSHTASQAARERDSRPPTATEARETPSLCDGDSGTLLKTPSLRAQLSPPVPRDYPGTRRERMWDSIVCKRAPTIPFTLTVPGGSSSK